MRPLQPCIHVLFSYVQVLSFTDQRRFTSPHCQWQLPSGEASKPAKQRAANIHILSCCSLAVMSRQELKPAHSLHLLHLVIIGDTKNFNPRHGLLSVGFCPLIVLPTGPNQVL